MSLIMVIRQIEVIKLDIRISKYNIRVSEYNTII